jgi:hypothetical protein
MGKRRKLIAQVILALDVLVCAVWIYWTTASMLRMLHSGGSGGMGAVSTGVELFFTVLPPILTITLARASGSTRVARYWRNAHLVVTLALIVLPLIGGLDLILVSIAVFQPVQVFFVIGAVAIWIGSPRRPPLDATEAS